MPKQVTIALKNRYCQARLRAAVHNEKFLTRAGAVEFLPGVTEDSLKKYELNINKTPNVVVAMMADAYNEPELRSWYCTNECPLGKNCREIPKMPPERVLIRLQNANGSIKGVLQELSNILDDGKLDDDEVKKLPELRDDLLEVRRRMDEALALLERATNCGVI